MSYYYSPTGPGGENGTSTAAGYPPPPAGYPTAAGAGAGAGGPQNPYSYNTGYQQQNIYGYQSAGVASSSYPQYQQQQQYTQKPPGFDVEAQQAAQSAAAFAEIKVRTAFVRKVFLLVLLELAITIGIACVFMFVNPVKEYVAGSTVPCSYAGASSKPVYVRNDGTCYQIGDGRWVFYTSWALTLVTLIALMCSTTLRRRTPWNYLAMFWFTIVMSVQVGCIVAYWDLSVVLIAFAVTGAAVVGVTLGALFVPFDLTSKGHILGMAALVVFMTALVTFLVGFFYVSKWWYLTLSVIIALLFAAFLLYDIQMVVGKGKYKLSPDEYVFAAVQIYLDIVIMFLNILNIVGIASS
jgi:FtsH-binding integral membrane protein